MNTESLRPLVLVVAPDVADAQCIANSLEHPRGAMGRWLRVHARSCTHSVAQGLVKPALRSGAPFRVVVIVETGDPDVSSAVLSRSLWEIDPGLEVIVLRDRGLKSEYVLEEIGHSDQVIVVPADIDDDELAQLVLRGATRQSGTLRRLG